MAMDIEVVHKSRGADRFEKALAAFPHRDEVEVVHRSFELDPGRPKGDVQPVLAMLSKKYGMSEAQAQAGENNLGAQAATECLRYRTTGCDHGNTFDMHRLIHFADARGKHEEDEAQHCSADSIGHSGKA